MEACVATLAPHMPMGGWAGPVHTHRRVSSTATGYLALIFPRRSSCRCPCRLHRAFSTWGLRCGGAGAAAYASSAAAPPKTRMRLHTRRVRFTLSAPSLQGLQSLRSVTASYHSRSFALHFAVLRWPVVARHVLCIACSSGRQKSLKVRCYDGRGAALIACKGGLFQQDNGSEGA